MVYKTQTLNIKEQTKQKQKIGENISKSKLKKAQIRILISDKVDLRTRNIIRDKEGHFIMIKGQLIKNTHKL